VLILSLELSNCRSQRDKFRLLGMRSDWIRGNGHKLKHRMFCTNVHKNFFTVRLTEHWKRLPREIVESPSLEMFKTCLETYLCSLV